MTQININEIKHNFPEYLSRAETGESFIITRDGKPVFELKYIEKNHTKEINTEKKKLNLKTYNDLNDLAGTWSEEYAAEFMEATKEFNRKDPELWK